MTGTSDKLVDYICIVLRKIITECILRVERSSHVNSVQPHLVGINLFVPETTVLIARLSFKLAIKQVERFLIFRILGLLIDTEKDFSNNSRMERQKQYLVNFMGQAVKAMKADMGLPVGLYQSLTDDMVTNLSLDRSVYLATEAMDMHFTADGIVSLKAKSKKGSVYDEVYVDDDALYDLIIQTFYTEEQSEGESK